MTSPPRPPPRQQTLAAALDALRLGRTGRAETLLRQILAARPSNIEASGNLRLLALRIGRPAAGTA